MYMVSEGCIVWSSWVRSRWRVSGFLEVYFEGVRNRFMRICKALSVKRVIGSGHT